MRLGREQRRQSQRAEWEQAAASAPQFSPTDLSGVITAWLRVPLATVTGLGISSLPDVLNSNPAVQATDAARPPRVTTTNGLLVARGVDDRMSWPANAANNQLVTWGFATHLIRDTTTTQAIYRSGLTTSSHPQATDSHSIFLTSGSAFQFLAFTDATGGQARAGTTPAAVLSTSAYRFVTVEFDGSQATDIDKCVITIDGVVQVLLFSNSVGAPGAFPVALQGQPGGTDIALFGQRTNATTSAFVGKMGPNIYILGGKMAGATEGLLTAEARAALGNFERPT